MAVKLHWAILDFSNTSVVRRDKRSCVAFEHQQVCNHGLNQVQEVFSYSTRAAATIITLKRLLVHQDDYDQHLHQISNVSAKDALMKRSACFAVPHTSLTERVVDRINARYEVQPHLTTISERPVIPVACGQQQMVAEKKEIQRGIRYATTSRDSTTSCTARSSPWKLMSEDAGLSIKERLSGEAV